MGMWFLHSFQSVWPWNIPATEQKEGGSLGRHCPAEQLWMKGMEFLKELRNNPAYVLAWKAWVWSLPQLNIHCLMITVYMLTLICISFDLAKKESVSEYLEIEEAWLLLHCSQQTRQEGQPWCLAIDDEEINKSDGWNYIIFRIMEGAEGHCGE